MFSSDHSRCVRDTRPRCVCAVEGGARCGCALSSGAPPGANGRSTSRAMALRRRARRKAHRYVSHKMWQTLFDDIILYQAPEVPSTRYSLRSAGQAALARGGPAAQGCAFPGRCTGSGYVQTPSGRKWTWSVSPAFGFFL